MIYNLEGVKVYDETLEQLLDAGMELMQIYLQAETIQTFLI